MKEPKINLLSPLKGVKYLFKKPVTLNVPKEEREAADRYRGFHTNDWETCIGCGSCSEICPTSAISMEKIPGLEIDPVEGKTDERPVIDYGRCCWCAFCVDICTTGSLKMSKDYVFIDPNPDKFIYIPDEEGINHNQPEEGYQRNEETDLLELERRPMEQAPAEERKSSFMEYVKGFSKEEAMREAARCVECGICTNTCPAHMNIPEYINAVFEDDLKEASDYLYRTNPLPAVCGRVCTHKCEDVCSIAHRGEAVSIRWLKRYIVDNTPEKTYEDVVMSTVSRKGEGNVAIVGAGPAGLAAAYYLRTLGHGVTVYEEKPLPGGVMRYGIPRYRLPDEALDKDISLIKKTGVEFLTGTRVGRDITLEELHEKYDAVFLSTGFMDPRDLGVPGSEHEDVVNAMDFLPRVTDYIRGAGKQPDVHEHAVVIGGGNVAYDVARSVVRLQMERYGKSDVKVCALECVKELPADLEEVEEGSEEGVKVYGGWGPKEIIIENGRIVRLDLVKCLSIFDENGRFSPDFDEELTLSIEGSQVFVSIGQAPDYRYLPESIQNQLEFKGPRIRVDEGGRTSLEWLFAGGDIVKGPDIITAVANGHEAAKSIDAYLESKK